MTVLLMILCTMAGSLIFAGTSDVPASYRSHMAHAAGTGSHVASISGSYHPKNFYVILPFDEASGDTILQRATAVSSPGSAHYGKFSEMFGLEDHPAVDQILYWLDTQTDLSCSKVWHGHTIACEFDVASVTSSFHVVWGKTETDIFAREISLPAVLKRHRATVIGLGSHANSALHRNNAKEVQTSDPNVVPQTIDALYSVPPHLTGRGTSVGAFEYQNDCGYNVPDFKAWGAAVGRPAPIPTAGTGGCTGGDIELGLDITVTCGVAHGANCTLDVVPGWTLEMAEFFLSTRGPDSDPVSMSNSWGWNWNYTCADVAPSVCAQNNWTSSDYIHATEVRLALIAATQPTSIIFSSGDAGLWGRAAEGESCENPRFGCPYGGCSAWTTSVGAVVSVDDGSTAWSDAPGCAANGSFSPCGSGTGTAHLIQFDNLGWSSGAGWIDALPAPGWQRGAVEGYLASNVKSWPSPRYWDDGSLASPDLVTEGHRWIMYSDGEPTTVSGTSMSSPVFAALVSIMNEDRLDRGQPGFGFLNPWLYAAAYDCDDCFNKVTAPGFNGCTEETCCSEGFYSSDSVWDSTTGLGRPNVTALLVWDRKLMSLRSTAGL